MLFDADSHILSKGENDTIRTPIRAQNPRQQDLELLVYISFSPLLMYFCKFYFSSILNLCIFMIALTAYDVVSDSVHNAVATC